MNLLTDPWLPVRTSGGRAMVKPSEIADPSVLALDFPRPDFNGAVAEFLIGLLSTTAAPQNENEWRRLWHERPTAVALQAKFGPAVEAFEFGRFMQADIDGERTNIEQLIPDSEGEITARQSVDLMNRVGQIAALSPAMAAAALITLQSHAPEGGSAPNDHSGKREGYYASIRGGGPLTTLVRAGTDLWGLIWPNVETREQLEARAVGPISSAALAAFPWMRGGLEDITPDNGHPCTVYWTTPRKVKLIVEPANGVMCDLTGEAGGQIVRHYVRASGGRRFVGWQHPLTPYRVVAHGKAPQRGRAQRIGMRDWLGLVQSATGDKRSPAQTVSHFRLHRWQVGDPRLNAYGYATNQAAVSAWQAGEMPLVVGDRETTQELERMAAQMVGATTEVTKHLTTAIRSCARRPDVAAESLWRTLEAPFLATLREVPTALAGEDDDVTLGLRRAWATQMRHTALRLFSETCPIDRDPGKVVRAQHALRQGLYSQKLAEILALPMEGRNAKR